MGPTGVAKMIVVTPNMGSAGLLVFSRGLSWAAYPILFYSLKNQTVCERQMSYDLLVGGCVSCTLSLMRSMKLPFRVLTKSASLYLQGVKHNQPHKTQICSLSGSKLPGYFTTWVDSFVTASPPHFCGARGRKELSPPFLGSTPPSPCFPAAGKRQPSAVHETEFKSFLSLGKVDQAQD